MFEFLAQFIGYTAVVAYIAAVLLLIIRYYE